MAFPFSIKKMDPRINAKLVKDFSGQQTGFVEVSEDKWTLPATYEQHAQYYYNLPVRADDIWTLGYPRSGTTVIQELLWLISNDLDYETALNVTLMERSLFLEFHMLINDQFKKDVIALNGGSEQCAAFFDVFARPGYESVAEMQSPRHIKSHLPLSLLPPNLINTCKAVYIARNPKDVAVSYYHHNRLLCNPGYERDFPAYWDYFERDLLIYSPYWKHVTEAWNQQNHPNMLFLFYEDLRKDLKGVIKRVAEHLGKKLTEEQVGELADHLHIDSFRENLSIKPVAMFKGLLREGEEPFIRSGQVGGKAEYYEGELNAQVDKWINKHLKKTDLRFPM